MIKNIFYISIFLFITTIFGQKKVEEVLKNQDGKIIEETQTSNTTENKTPEKILDIFYNNLNDFKALNSLFSFRFFQKTPYVQFKETMTKKNNFCGNLKKKSVVKMELSEDGKSAAYEFRVKYENATTLENFVLIKETEKDDFKIFGYNISVLNE